MAKSGYLSGLDRTDTLGVDGIRGSNYNGGEVRITSTSDSHSRVYGSSSVPKKPSNLQSDLLIGGAFSSSKGLATNYTPTITSSNKLLGTASTAGLGFGSMLPASSSQRLFDKYSLGGTSLGVGVGGTGGTATSTYHREERITSSHGSSGYGASSGAVLPRITITGTGTIPSEGSSTYREVHTTRLDSSSHKRDSSLDPTKLRMSRTSTGNIKESVVREITHEPKVVEVRTLEPVEVMRHSLQPVLKGIVHSEHQSETIGIDFKKMLVDCFKRIVLLGMENERLVGHTAHLEHVIIELESKLH